MVVLSIIGAILGLMLLYSIVVKINQVSYRENRYEYFTPTTAGSVVVGYYFLYFGYQSYEAASRAVNGDILNGILLMVIGGVLVGAIIISNFINTPKENKFITLLFTSIQLVIYVGVAYVSIFLILAAIGVLAQTKPVYVLNND